MSFKCLTLNYFELLPPSHQPWCVYQARPLSSSYELKSVSKMHLVTFQLRPSLRLEGKKLRLADIVYLIHGGAHVCQFYKKKKRHLELTYECSKKDNTHFYLIGWNWKKKFNCSLRGTGGGLNSLLILEIGNTTLIVFMEDIAGILVY